MHKYCSNLNKYQRFKSRKVVIGDIPLGYGYPIRIQSMTTTNTLDVESTVKQSMKIIDAGSDYVRITAPSIKEAKALKQIKKKLVSKKYNTPLIADIHFTPNAAIEAAQIVEKVRINPGNYADRKKFKIFEYTDAQYNNELNRIYERFSPLVKVCKENGTAMRIGTNHGSLSDRIMNRYGDTPLGMVESAMEFLRICEDHRYHNIVLSMKSSNPIVMVQAYRLLINKMIDENMNYPLHLGVTEAGEGMEGRVKSSIGIGALLEDGLGDTIRVSLTEDPELEIPVAKKIVDKYKSRNEHNKIKHSHIPVLDPFNYSRRKTKAVLNIGKDNVPVVMLDLSYVNNIDLEVLENCGYYYNPITDKWNINDLAADYIYIKNKKIDINLPIQLRVVCDYSYWKDNNMNSNIYPKLTVDEYVIEKIEGLKFLYLSCEQDLNDSLVKLINEDDDVVILIDTTNSHGLVDQRNLILNFIKYDIRSPVIINRYYNDLTLDETQINASVDIGGLLVDGLGDGLFISHNNIISICEANKLSFEILQSTRTRITKTDFISCPSCGRTQFDLMETTAKVRAKTSHLKGLKIAIMGCIVNGPGEMADADYGYVGIGFEKISLYKGHDVIKRGIPEEAAVDELINLIKENGDWTEP
tara:strand:+ start:9094 stop:11013 length:1920 start_codon:yes stop_codon:yes gene_type:complete